MPSNLPGFLAPLALFAPKISRRAPRFQVCEFARASAVRWPVLSVNRDADDVRSYPRRVPREEPLQICLECGRSLHSRKPLLSAFNHVPTEGGDIEVESVIQHVVVKDADRTGLHEDRSGVKPLVRMCAAFMQERTPKAVAVGSADVTRVSRRDPVIKPCDVQRARGLAIRALQPGTHVRQRQGRDERKEVQPVVDGRGDFLKESVHRLKFAVNGHLCRAACPPGRTARCGVVSGPKPRIDWPPSGGPEVRPAAARAAVNGLTEGSKQVRFGPDTRRLSIACSAKKAFHDGS